MIDQEIQAPLNGLQRKIKKRVLKIQSSQGMACFSLNEILK